MIKFYSQNIWNNAPAGYRTKLLRSVIRDVDADICSFQECGPETNRNKGSPKIGEVMSDEYVESLPQFSTVNFTPVFYKKDRFNLIDGGYCL